MKSLGRSAHAILASAALATILDASAAPNGGEQVTIDRVSWLQGCWEEVSPKGTVEEQWVAPRGGTMLGMGRTVRDGRLTEFEVVVIREQDGRLAYEAHPSGQPSAVFLSGEVTGTRVVFENPTHDFPQAVGYERAGQDALHTWVEGSQQGRTKRIEFPYLRVACPGSAPASGSAPAAAGTPAAGSAAAGAPSGSGFLLGDLTWVEAERRLTPETIVVIPLGAGSKEHGPHLRLDNDWVMAEYLKGRVAASSDVAIAPTIPYHFYPAFVEYPGSTTLRLETARDLVVDVVRSLARHGPRRFYVLNTGISTVRPLRAASETLAAEGLLLRFTDLGTAGAAAVKEVSREEGGTHADEVETSMMLYIDPASVDMAKAVKDYHPGEGPLTRSRTAHGTYSPSGIFGDPTLATAAKGRIIVEATVNDILADIESLRRAPLP